MKNNCLLICLIIMGSAVCSWAAGTNHLYDDFSAPKISPAKWDRSDWVTEVNTTTEKLVMKSGNTTSDSSGLVFLNPEMINSISADITLIEVTPGARGETWAFASIDGIFYNANNDSPGDSSGDVWARIAIGDRGNGIEAWYIVEKFVGDNPFGESIASGTLVTEGQLSLDLVYNLSIGFDGDIFTFAVSLQDGSLISAQTAQGPEVLSDAFAPDKGLLLNLYADPDVESYGYLHYLIDNVAINDEVTLYDTFDNGSIDTSKWGTKDRAREVSADHKLRMKTVALNGQRSDNYTTFYENPSFISADITIDSQSEVPAEGRNRYRLEGWWYNDSRGPGSGLPYLGLDRNVWAMVYIDVYADRIEPKVWVAAADGENWDSDDELYFHQFSTSVVVDVPITVSIGFTGEKFIFTCGNETTEYVVTTPVYPPAYHEKTLRVRSQPDDGYDGVAIGSFDNVYVKQSNLLFPHIDTTAPWNSEFGVINTSDKDVHGTLVFFDDIGDSLGVPITVSLGSNERIQYDNSDILAISNEVGFVIFESPSEAVKGYSKFYQEGKYRVATPAVSHLNTMEVPLSHVASNESWWTGVSLINPSNLYSDVVFEFDNGITKTLTLMPSEHRAFTIRELFDGTPATDVNSAIIKSDYGVVGLELFGSVGEGENYLSGLLLTDSLTTEIVYPHIASDMNWWTGIVAFNPSQTVGNQITLTPFSADGTQLISQLINLGPGEKYVGTAAALNLPESTAWFQLKGTEPMTGFELFGTTDGKQLAGYTGVDIKGTSGVFQKIDKDGWTGVAFVNTENSMATISLTAHNNENSYSVTKTLILNPFEKKVGLVEDIFTEGGGAGIDLSIVDYVTYESDKNIVGFQLNGSTDSMLLDGLPAN